MEWHSLFKRQLKRQFGEEAPPASLTPFFESVNQAYLEFDEDRRLLERSLELSSTELLQANTDMRALFDAFPDLLFRVNSEGAIIDYRAGKEMEAIASQGQWSGKRIQEAFGATAKPILAQALTRVQREGKVPTAEFSISAKGEDQYYEARFLPIDKKQIVVMIRDITSRKKLEAQLLQSQKLDTLGTLAGSVAHDLNNQLTPLAGYLNMLLTLSTLDQETTFILKEADQAAKRCADIVRRLLNFSKPSSLEKKAINPEKLLDEIRKMLPHFIPSTIQTHVEIEPDLWDINGNETELETVIVNLIANARDAMPNGGKLTIRVNKNFVSTIKAGQSGSPKPYVIISILDTGTGMPPEVLKRIFEPFYSTKGLAKGTGLGLSMAAQIVKAHDGWIDVSTELGKGTSFQIYLPTTADIKKPAEVSAGFNTTAAKENKGTILFVDDEEHIRVMGKFFLQKMGYTVLLAKNGLDAIEQYTENRAQITAVISDMTMPQMTGRQVLKSVLEIQPKAVVILCSGYTDDGSREDLIRLGAKDFIQKPYTFDMLAQSLSQSLGTGTARGRLI